MKKRFLAAVLALAMAAACMTACGGENKTEDKQQTTTTTAEEVTTTTTAETTTATTAETTTTTAEETTTTTTAETTTTTTAETTTTTTTTKAATTTKKATTTTSMPNGKAEYKITTIKVTTTKVTGGASPEVPQDVNPGQWHDDPGITKADLKAAAEAAFAKVKKTAKEYGWTITKTFVNRSTDTQYGIYYRVELTTDKNMWGEYTIKAESLNGKVSLQDSELPMGVKTKDYDSFSITYGIDVSVNFFKENGVKKKQ